MPTTRTFKQAFSGGEISPEMFGRIADNKFHAYYMHLATR